MDTSVPQFYPTLFVLVTDVMDTVGNLVWDRIKKKAEFDDAGNLIASLPGAEPFEKRESMTVMHPLSTKVDWLPFESYILAFT